MRSPIKKRRLITPSPIVDEELRPLLLLKDKSETEGATVNELTLNLIAVGLGTGLLSMPWGTAGASILVAIALNAVVLSLTAWTLRIIIEAGEKYQKFDLGSLLECIPGSVGFIMYSRQIFDYYYYY
jgi:hypothetical protein